uniref:Ribonuclease L n=1 Tax=Latimeria chalumnae TaxID=7897 RepID=H2ZU23_LATCH
IKLVKELIENGADVNHETDFGWTPLLSAVQANKEDVVKQLLAHGANPLHRKKNGATPFILAGIVGNRKLLKLFLSEGADINECDKNGFTAFMEAAVYGRKGALKFLYKKGAEVNKGREGSNEHKSLRKGGCTALMDAAKKGHNNIIKLLIDKMKASVNAQDNLGRTALIHAFQPGKKPACSTVKLLLARGAVLNVSDGDKKTPLILAAEKNSIKLLKILMKKDGNDVNAKDKTGTSALLIAVNNNNYEMAKLLCKNHADVNCRDKSGNTPIKVANRNYNHKLVNLLRKYEQSKPLLGIWNPVSKYWKVKLEKLITLALRSAGELKFLIDEDYKIAESSQGGVYLGFYGDGVEVAVKRMRKNSNEVKMEKLCLEHPKIMGNSCFVKLYGSETDATCHYLCLTLCECTLETYIQEEEGNLKTKVPHIFKQLIGAVQILHEAGFAHTDLHPSNILFNVEGKLQLADFDKCLRFEDCPHKGQSERSEAIGNLLCYVTTEGKYVYKTEEEKLGDCYSAEVRDLIQKLSAPQGQPPPLKEALQHPFFWSQESKYRFLQDIGNENEVKVRNDKHEIVKSLNEKAQDPSSSFREWTKKVNDIVFKNMDSRNRKPELKYRNDTASLLKFIRNMGAHFEEKPLDVLKDKSANPCNYFLDLFPDLVISVYNVVKSTQWEEHFPKAETSLKSFIECDAQMQKQVIAMTGA